MKNVNDIRSSFLDYFHRNGHEIVPSGSLIPHNDPSLMFTNAGMVPFKNIFTGLEKAPYSRATTAQKCVRAGGKHNDLDNVGYTARHHTFFEMLGNFSFGEYFKEEAIFFAWNLLTKEFGLPKEKLLVTVYHEDVEAAALWRKIAGLSNDKIIPIATTDNFWSMGDTGPCGPCSEIFYDHGDHIFGGPPGTPDEDGDRFTEIWNLVFMQFETLNDGSRISLPHPSIDTGMGLERISAVLQGVHDNYDIDLFQTLIKASQELSGVKAEGEFAISHRVIADHLRSTAFLLADGVLPSNEGRGYVLRRIMRRAMRHVQLLRGKQPLMYRLVPTLVEEMGQAYPELVRAQSLIVETLKLEETRFQKMLARGLNLLNEATNTLESGAQLKGEIAFKLYDTYGFPLDLTQEALRSRNIQVDIEGFDAAMAQQKMEARAHWTGSGEAIAESRWFALRDKIGPTEFLGYDQEESEGLISALFVNGEEVQTISQGQDVLLFANQTPFYAESGGQVGDQGIISKCDALFEVLDSVKKVGSLYAHIGRVNKGTFTVGDHIKLEIDKDRRQKIRANHSATHLLHEALRQVLGPHIAQKGSLVSAEKLRFDFSHNHTVSREELAKIETLVNKVILQNQPVTTRLMPLEEAISSGARALFGEKYGQDVRVVFMGQQETVKNNNDNSAWSVELCGGTHVKQTGNIGLVHIISEGAVASGVRRIEALVGEAARQYFIAQDDLVKDLAQKLKISEADLAIRVDALQEERKKLEKDLVELKKKMVLQEGTAQLENIEQIHGVAFMAQVSHEISAKDLRSLIDSAKKQLKSGIALFMAIDENEKASVAIGVTSDLIDRYDAVTLLQRAVIVLGGTGGGGRKDMAQGGGPLGKEAQKAIEAVRQLL